MGTFVRGAMTGALLITHEQPYSHVCFESEMRKTRRRSGGASISAYGVELSPWQASMLKYNRVSATKIHVTPSILGNIIVGSRRKATCA